MVELSELGDRICIMGPSNSGKSTLADWKADYSANYPVLDFPLVGYLGKTLVKL